VGTFSSVQKFVVFLLYHHYEILMDPFFSYFHWVAGATDNAIYPSLFLQYLAQYTTSGDDAFFSSDLVRFVFTLIISAVLALINYSGLEIVGTLSMMICVISMSPFVILCIIGLPKIDPQRWLVMPDTNMTNILDDDEIGPSSNTFLPALTYSGVMWRPFINILFWNLNSFDVGASFAGEVHDPDHVFPRAMFLSVFFVVVGYLVPLLVAIGASDSHQSEWDAGFFTTVSNEIAGPWLAGWTVLAAAVSNIGLFEAEMSGDAYQLMGMADRGLIPKIFCKRSRFGTPTYGILVGTFVIFALGIADFDALVEMLNFAYSISLLMEFSAFIKLRITDSDGKWKLYKHILYDYGLNSRLTALVMLMLPLFFDFTVIRPYRVPFNTFGCVLFITPSCLICLFVMASATKTTYIYFVALLSFGVVFHFLQKMAKHYHWWEYAVAPPKKSSAGKRTPVGSNNSPLAPAFSSFDDDNNSTAESSKLIGKA
jgi:amino acid transporter